MKIKNIFEIEENIVTCNENNFRMVATTKEKTDKIIEYIVKINKRILKKYKTFIYKINLENVNLTDIQYTSFFIKLITILQEKFKDELEVLYLTNTSPYFSYVWSIINYIIYPDILKKIKIS
jgi:hypothetical protein